MPLDLLWMAPALSGGGYASEAISFAQGLAPQLHAFALRQFAEQPAEDFVAGFATEVTSAIRDVYEPPNASPSLMSTRRAPDVVVCHSPPDAWVPSKFPGWDELSPCPPPGQKRKQLIVGRTMFETDSIPLDWATRCEKMDAIWVPTRFHQDAFRRAGVSADKLFVLGEAVDATFFDPSKTTPLALPTTAAAAPPPFRFLSIFKWEQRKGWDALLAAYFAEFRADDHVELVLKTRPFHSDGDFVSIIDAFAAERGLPARRAERPAVRVLDEEMTMVELRSLYAAADAFVLPSRGEGWGRPHVEAMAMALPVLATNWSGPTSYLDDDVGYPLPCAVVAVPDELNLPGHHWAEPSVSELRARMRRLYDHPDEGKRKGAAARQRMVSHFSPTALADEVVRLVDASKKVKEEAAAARRAARGTAKQEL